MESNINWLFCALRGPEYTIDYISGYGWTSPLLIDNVVVLQDPKSIAITIPRTKTNRHGRTIYLACVPSPLCPVCAIIAYLGSRAPITPLMPLFFFLITLSSLRWPSTERFNHWFMLWV